MFRIMSIATLVLIVLCFFVGAGLAFANPNGCIVECNDSEIHINDSSLPVEEIDELNLAERDIDRYDFSDYIKGVIKVPTVDAESIEEPGINRDILRDV